MSVKCKLNTITVPATEECLGSIIFLHGSGGSAEMCRECVAKALGEDLTFPHLQILYPTAPLQPYSKNDGAIEHVWFDRIALHISATEQVESTDRMALTINDLIEEEIKSGIPAENIILGGFSMGGSMALHVGLRYLPSLRGIFCSSSFLNDESQVYKDLKRSPGLYPPVFMSHGDVDDEVLFEWGQKTKTKLIECMIQTQFYIKKEASHENTREEITQLKHWIFDQFPYKHVRTQNTI